MSKKSKLMLVALMLGLAFVPFNSALTSDEQSPGRTASRSSNADVAASERELTVTVFTNPATLDVVKTAGGGPFYVGGTLEDPETHEPIGSFHSWGFLFQDGTLRVMNQEYDLKGRGKIILAGVEDTKSSAITGGTGIFRNVRGQASGIDLSNSPFPVTFELIGAGRSAALGQEEGREALNGSGFVEKGLPPDSCDNDGTCELGEDCNTCPADCPSFPIGGAVPGNNVCEAGDGETCYDTSDCNGMTTGKPSNRFCCGLDSNESTPYAPNGCDATCVSGGNTCTTTPVGGGGSTCCGDGLCEGAEDCGNCPLDCSTGLEVCDDGIDNDCNGSTDCADPNCDSDPACPSGGPGSGECDGEEAVLLCHRNRNGKKTEIICVGPEDNGELYADHVAHGDNEVGPEVCDGIDNDCDGVVPDDEADADSDGFRICGGDCADDDPLINPDAADICDGADNDCDPASNDGDEDPGLGDACDGDDSDLCTDDAKICTAGALVCTSGGDNLELCDSMDNDCNPSTADGADEPTLGDACDGDDADLCAEGVIECSGEALSCNDPNDVDAEICDGADNDCNGATADGADEPTLGDACDGDDADLCAEGVIECSGEALSCNDPNDVDAEICDGADNDCNGATADGADEPTLGDACDGDDADLCAEGVIECSGEALSCNDPNDVDAEICDDLDNDCDGAVDNGFNVGSACEGVGECGDGVIECTDTGATVCSTDVGSSSDGSVTETCDGLDNDCDGSTDEDCRFTVNGDGTVTDTQTGLVWLQDASCAEIPGTDDEGRADWWVANGYDNGTENPANSPTGAAALAHGMCSLTDGSTPGDWRLPTLECSSGLCYPIGSHVAIGEFPTIFGPQCSDPPYVLNTAGTSCLSEGDPFSGVQDYTGVGECRGCNYWSSTSLSTTHAYVVRINRENVDYLNKAEPYYVWPVRNAP